MVEKGIKEGICRSINIYAKANDAIWKIIWKKSYMEDYDKNKESPYLKYWDVNNVNGWAILQKVDVSGFNCIEDLS